MIMENIMKDKKCGCADKVLCIICIKNHKGSLYGYQIPLEACFDIPLALNIKTYDPQGNLIKEETKPIDQNNND